METLFRPNKAAACDIKSGHEPKAPAMKRVMVALAKVDPKGHLVNLVQAFKAPKDITTRVAGNPDVFMTSDALSEIQCMVAKMEFNGAATLQGASQRHLRVTNVYAKFGQSFFGFKFHRVVYVEIEHTTIKTSYNRWCIRLTDSSGV